MTRRLGVICGACLLLGALAFVVVIGQNGMYDRDWFTFWGGGRGVLNSADIYDPIIWAEITRDNGSPWLPNPIFIFAPPTAILFAPFAALRVDVAAFVWTWLSEIFVVLSVWLIARGMCWTRLVTVAPFWSVGISLFLPCLLTLLMGQVSALLLILVVSAAVLWDRDRWLAGGLLLGLTIVKPQPVAFLIPMIALWLLVNRRWRALVGLAVSLGTGVFATLVFFPTFFQDWQIVVTTKVGGVAARMPTIWGLTLDLFGASSLALASAATLCLLALAACGFIILRWHDCRALELVSVLLVFSLLVTPYLWNYDQILLVMPLLVALIRLDQRGVSFRTMVLFLPLVLDLIAIVFFVIASIRLEDALSASLSILVGVVLWSALGKRSRLSIEGVL